MIGQALGQELADVLVALILLASFVCVGYELGRRMEASTPKRFHRYFDQEDWRALGHCRCCPARDLPDGPGDDRASGGARDAEGVA